MNSLLTSQKMTEWLCSEDFVYILKDSDMFQPAQYKALRGQRNGLFVPCQKILVNGQTSLYYDVGDKRPLTSLLPQMTPGAFRQLAGYLLQSVLLVKAIGFLRVENLDIDLSKVFVDSSTLKPSLVYVPVGERLHNDTTAMESRLRGELALTARGVPTLDSPKTVELAEALGNLMLSLQDLVNELGVDAQSLESVEPVLELRLINHPEELVFRIKEDSFVLGHGEMADGVIAFNRYVGSKHCCIEREDGVYRLRDLDSKNGSYVNETQISGLSAPLKNGDIIRLANIEFRVTI